MTTGCICEQRADKVSEQVEELNGCLTETETCLVTQNQKTLTLICTAIEHFGKLLRQILPLSSVSEQPYF